ncbi:MAG: SIS domain-containing protein [Kiritimatiellae bacterium]|nr:SIS domain-containing protein [Kiritimatiellia bacterium]
MNRESTGRKLRESIAASSLTVASLAEQAEQIAAVGHRLVEALRAGGKLLTAGNGGSAAEALHMAEELVGRFRTNRRSLPAVALVADPTALTCIGNDFGFDCLFSRQVEGLGNQADMLVLFSTSGNAPNLKNALEAARRKQMTVACFLGRDGGPLAGLGDFEIIVKGDATARIQEAHQVLVHLMLEIVEDAFAGET